MPQDAFTLRHVKNCLSQKLIGGKISKINQPDKNTVLLFIYTEKGTVKLEICTSAKNNCVNLALGEKPNPQTAPNFCMLLRKHLQNAEILSVEQVGFERIIYFDLRCFSEFSVVNLRLYMEIMGKYSNVVLTENGTILGALKCTSLETNMKRVLFPGVKYTLPEPQEKVNPQDFNALCSLFENKCGDAVDFISSRVSGIAYTTAVEMVETYGENITAKDVYEYIFSDDISPCITIANGQYTDFKARSTSKEKIAFDDLLDAQAKYYFQIERAQEFSAQKTKLTSALSGALKKADKRLLGIIEKERECEKADEVKLWGELITANIYAVQKGDCECRVVNYYDENQPTITIKLDKQLTPSQNAQKYYKKYAKLKRTQENLLVQREQTERQIDYLNSIKSSIETAENIDDLKEIEGEIALLGLIKIQAPTGKKKAESNVPFRRYEIDGFTLLVGRNNAQNDRLLKSVNQDDLWLHVKKYHSSHAVILTLGRQVPTTVIERSAEICAYYSLGRGASKVAVDYTIKKNVKKPPKSNLGFVIYTDYKTILVEPKSNGELRKEN